MSYDFARILDATRTFMAEMDELGCPAKVTVADADGTQRFTMKTTGFQETS